MKKDAYFIVENLKKTWENADSAFTLDIDFSVDKGEMLCIAGQSGSGKSTILRIISGILPFEKGARLVLDGKDISTLPPGKRDIGMVFQNPTLFPHMQVEDNIAFGLISRKFAKKDARFRAAALLERFGLSGFAKRYPDSLSGGEAQRVALARTLIVEPKLVLFDEPFSSLDAPLRKSLALDIRQSQRELGFTGILVTHDIEEAKTMSDRVIVLKKGSLFWQGVAKDFEESHVSSF
ncbi:MAG TPA: ABC transporter ATP-binding protein [Treponemataceae bacterium]|nr:ABC transporter ATP-binding protein [Treponemataceae bacterium]